MQGLLHSRISVCYLQAVEVVSDKDMWIISLIVNSFDSFSIVISCLVILFYKNDLDLVLQGAWYLGVFTSILYLIVVPESPRWLFMGDSNSQEGIAAVNFIAWFNGSEFRVP